MKIYIFNDYNQVSKKAAELVIKEINKKHNLVLGLPTGSSPTGMYKNLVEAYKNNEVSFKEVRTFNLDEYVGIDPSHPQSYNHFMHEHFFDLVDIDNRNTYLPSGDEAHLTEMVHDYYEILKNNPRDLQVLGIGSNAHIGFNEPGVSFDKDVYVALLDEQTRKDNARFFNSIEEVPLHAVTMGIRAIMNSKKIILIATGEAKANAVYNMVNAQVSPEVPASFLQQHSDVIVLLDKAAASKL